MATTDARIASPLRTCIGCRRQLPQSELVRCVAGPPGPIVSRTAAGRGAWLCSTACFHTAARRKAFDRAWKRQVHPDVLQTLAQALCNAFDHVIINMEELPAVRVATGEPTATKG